MKSSRVYFGGRSISHRWGLRLATHQKANTSFSDDHGHTACDEDEDDHDADGDEDEDEKKKDLGLDKYVAQQLSCFNFVTNTARGRNHTDGDQWVIKVGNWNDLLLIYKMLLVKSPVRIMAASVVVTDQGFIESASRWGKKNQDWCNQNYPHLVLDYWRVGGEKIIKTDATKTILILWQGPEWSCHITSILVWDFTHHAQ